MSETKQPELQSSEFIGSANLTHDVPSADDEDMKVKLSGRV